MLESFSYSLAKQTLMDKPRASRKVQLSKMTRVLDSQYLTLIELLITIY